MDLPSPIMKSETWRDRWVVSNWLAAVPLLRILTLASRREAFLALGADTMMIAGMVIGMDLGSDEVAFLDHAMALPPAAAKADFGHLIGLLITVTMVLGMAAGMILWNMLAPLLCLDADQPEESAGPRGKAGEIACWSAGESCSCRACARYASLRWGRRA